MYGPRATSHCFLLFPLHQLSPLASLQLLGFVNAFQLGAFMEKQLTMRGGQTPVQVGGGGKLPADDGAACERHALLLAVLWTPWNDLSCL